MPAILGIAMLLVLGATLIIAGMFVIAGWGSALLTAGVLTFATAALLRAGVKSE